MNIKNNILMPILTIVVLIIVIFTVILPNQNKDEKEFLKQYGLSNLSVEAMILRLDKLSMMYSIQSFNGEISEEEYISKKQF